MNNRQITRHTASLLRAVLLGVMILIGLPSQAQRTNPAERYITPTSIIGDGNYYRVQFVTNDAPAYAYAYLTESGYNQVVRSAAFDEDNDGQLWTFIRVGNGNTFRMQSKNGRYIIWNDNRFRTPTAANNTEANAVTLGFFARNNYYFEIYRTDNNNGGMNRFGGGQYAEIGEWTRNDINNRLIINSLEYREVTHRISYLYDLNKNYDVYPGLATRRADYWDSEKGIQKVNEFKITHYVPRGTTFTAIFPTCRGTSNDHTYYQRFYNYDNETDLAGLEERIGNNNVWFYRYKNGFVTGSELYWSTVTPNDNRNAVSSINYTNTDGQPFTLAVDVSRGSDYTYENATNRLEGNLEEPSLSMRYIYYMRDAKEMANALTQLKLTGTPTIQTIENEEFYEEKEIHFPQIENLYRDNNNNLMNNNYQGEFLGLRHSFEDYWVYSNNDANANADNLLINLANTNRIQVVIYDDNRTGINLTGNTKGYYLFENNLNESRFLNFRYPAAGETNDSRRIADANFTEKDGTETKPAYVCCYLNNNGTRYKVAKFKIIFDKPKVGNRTSPWTSIRNTARDPSIIQAKAGKAIAKISFDNPTGSVFRTAPRGATNRRTTDAEVPKSGGTPLLYGPTNYSFDADDNRFGAYALLTDMETQWGNKRILMPANDPTYGTGRQPADGMTRHFMYIDASEQPGDICSVDFVGDFCSGDKLMCTGWIAGTNRPNDDQGSEGRGPGGVTVTVKGERKEPDGTITSATIKRYNPGMSYEVRYQSTGYDQWQQFYFEFSVDRHYDRYWLEVNNNSLTSSGADFCLDDVEVFCLKPDVATEIYSPLCVGKSGSDLKLLELTADFDQMLEVKGEIEGSNTNNIFGLVFLNKDVFLDIFREEVGKVPGYESYGTMPLDQFEEYLNKSAFDLTVFDAAYKIAFDAALLGKKEIWNSTSMHENPGSCVMNFHWNTTFEAMPEYNFGDAISKTSPIYRLVDTDGKRKLVMNGNFPGIKNWRPYVNYYIVTYNEGITSLDYLYDDFNLRSECKKKKTFRLDPPAQLLSIEDRNSSGDLEVCEGKIPTVLTDLKGLNSNGQEVSLENLNFDWWLGDPENGIYATLDNYHNLKYQKQPDGTYTTSNATGASGITIGSAISSFRGLYEDNTSLVGVVPKKDDVGSVEVTQEQLDLLNYLVQKGQLFLHTKSVNVYAKPVSSTEPYFYLVASPIHDDLFRSELNSAAKDVKYLCDEPQGLRMIVSEKAPTVSNGFANGSNGIDTYNYPVELRTLSLRLAKRAQFDVVRHGSIADLTNQPIANVDTYLSGDRDSLLFLPLRNANAPSTGATGVITKAADENIYLSMSDDPTADALIYNEMKTNKTLPVVGRIVQLRAHDKVKAGVSDSEASAYNRLVIYFYDAFTVHEGYNYTLSLPFRENGSSNTCDGTLLMHLKIVPDYEVWTGLANHTADQTPDWSNDANWRRADADELYLVKFDGREDYRDPNPKKETWNTNAQIARHTYLTNGQNYQSATDKVTRKGFAPLYCTHILMKTDETSDVPYLYDKLDGKATLDNSPFPNLRITATDILKYDMQARDWSSWKVAHNTDTPPAGSKSGDQIAEMYETNVCDEIVFQPKTELVNAQQLTYNKAWVEYALEKDSWQLVSSPLQGMISGEWYAPTGTAQQKTTYYEPVEYNILDYDRFSPAVYQRSWDKAKAVFYDRGAIWSSTDGSQTQNLGSYNTGTWGTAEQSAGSAFTWIADQNADDYLQRLSYRPMGDSKANVAMKGTWSNVFNDHTVSYDQGGFSVLVINSHKGNDTTPGEKSLFRLPKEDYYYDIWDWGQSYVEPRRVRVYMDDGRPFPAGIESDGNYRDPITAENTLSLKDDDGKSKRGRLRSDAFKKSGEYSVALANEGGSNLGYFLVGNPFICGLNVADMMANNSNSGKVNTSVTITTDAGPKVYSYNGDASQWECDGVAATPIVPQGQAFFLQVPTTATDKNNLTLTFTPRMMTTAPRASNDPTGGNGNNGNEPGGNNDPTGGNGNNGDNGNNGGNPDGSGTTNPVKPFATRAAAVEQPTSLVITASRGHRKSTAVVKCSEGAENAFVENEDVPMFVEESVMDAPTIYTLCGRLATSVNRLRDFRVLPIGIESNSNDMVTVSFNGVEAMGDSLQLYDAQTGELMPLQSGTTTTMPGQTMNRYYIISGTYQSELVSESRLQIYCDDRQVTVQTSGGESITQVNAYDPAGRRVYSAAPQSVEHHFTLTPGVYLIEAKTDACRKTVKIVVK